MLQAASGLAGGAVLSWVLPGTLVHAASRGYAQQTGAAADAAAAFRAHLASRPVQAQKLADNLTLLSGPGGNVVVLNGPDGKLVVDTFVAPAWPKLKDALYGIGDAPVKFVIDTHWHFDHTDNNAELHAAGATVMAHQNTKKRMSELHELPVLGLKFPPSPAAALPQKTFRDSYRLQANGENLEMSHVAPAHTDTDIYIHFQKANVLHAGDLFFNGLYPYIDGGTGGKIGGMIANADKILALTDNHTKIIPGHGPLGNKSDLKRFRDMLSTARERVQQLKTSGKSMQEAIAAKPFDDLEPAWGKGFFNGDTFVQVVYITL
jgi:glyoxylase-like metal-dependent hydrolase (beta-lactamase superfamily II)